MIFPLLEVLYSLLCGGQSKYKCIGARAKGAKRRLAASGQCWLIISTLTLEEMGQTDGRRDSRPLLCAFRYTCGKHSNVVTESYSDSSSLGVCVCVCV